MGPLRPRKTRCFRARQAKKRRFGREDCPINAAKPSENAIFQDETPYFTILLGAVIFERFCGLFGWPFGGPWGLLGALLGRFWPPWRLPGALLAPLGALLGPKSARNEPQEPPGPPKWGPNRRQKRPKAPQGAPAAPKMSPRTSQELQNEPVETQVSRSSDKPPRAKEGSAAGAQPKDTKMYGKKNLLGRKIADSTQNVVENLKNLRK